MARVDLDLAEMITPGIHHDTPTVARAANKLNFSGATTAAPTASANIRITRNAFTYSDRRWVTGSATTACCIAATPRRTSSLASRTKSAAACIRDRWRPRRSPTGAPVWSDAMTRNASHPPTSMSMRSSLTVCSWSGVGYPLAMDAPRRIIHANEQNTEQRPIAGFTCDRHKDGND